MRSMARQMAKGNTAEAVNAWLTGLRFAQHVGKDLSLIGVLSAKTALVTDLHLLPRAVQSGTVNTTLQNKIRGQLHQLPKEGLNWEDAIKAEAWANEQSLKYLANAVDFQEAYKKRFQ